MSARNQIALLEADARYLRERLALNRAKLYGRGLGSSARLRELERELARAERRLSDHRSPGAG